MNATQNLFYYYFKLDIICYLNYSNFVISKIWVLQSSRNQQTLEETRRMEEFGKRRPSRTRQGRHGGHDGNGFDLGDMEGNLKGPQLEDEEEMPQWKQTTRIDHVISKHHE
jgi:hypothetical protein